MNLANRRRLLRIASMLDRWAMRIRQYVKAKTPKKPRKAAVVKDK